MKLLIDVNQLLWNGPILVMLFGTHVYFTLRLRLVQRKIGYGISLSLSDGSKNKKGFGRFGSLTTTLAATLGTGNIIGISTAVFLGGPGAVFWCWLTGLLGMATTYAETFLCHHFRYQGHGGPMYILHFLLHKKTLALLYSAALTLSAFFIGCTTQSNAITETCHQVFSLPHATCAIITAFFVGLILMQGRKWIENVSIAIVPTMAIFFFGGCLLYLILHADYLLPSLKLIFSSAFALPSIGGGFAGYTMGKAIRYGVARGLFTNESGLGTTGLIAGHCSEDDSVKQAAISMSATFWDTVVLCAITGLVLVCYQLEFPSEWQTLPASALTTAAFGKLPFFGDEILSIAIISFALATLIGWSYLGKQGFDYLFQGKYERFYQTLYLIMIFSGGIMPLALVWEMTDFINLFLLLPNIYLLVRCRKYVKKE